MVPYPKKSRQNEAADEFQRIILDAPEPPAEYEKLMDGLERPDCPWVFFHYGKRIKDFRGAWEGASKRVGLWNDETGKPKHIFHDLRRTGATNLVRAGLP